MATTERPVLTGARWSHATRCARMAAYDVLRAMPAPPSDRVARLFDRGRDVEDAYFRRLAETYSGRVVRQAAIPWGNGWHAHCDGIFVDEPDRLHVEVKSTVDVGHLPGVPVSIEGVDTTSAVLQVVGAAAFDPEGGVAEVVTISPVDYFEQRWPIQITTDLSGAVHEISDRVVRVADGGDLPERCCQKPTDAIGRFCPYKDTCFADWEEPEPVTLDDEQAFSLVGHLVALEQAVKLRTEEMVTIKAARDEKRAETAATLALQPGQDYHVGQTRLRISSVKGRVTFDHKAAIASGRIPRDVAETYTKTGAASERWIVEPEEAES